MRGASARRVMDYKRTSGQERHRPTRGSHRVIREIWTRRREDRRRQRRGRSLQTRGKGLPEGRTMKAVAGYLYFPGVSPRLVNSNEPYHLNYSGLNGQLDLTVPAK